MARWRVDYIGKDGKHLGTKKSAIAEAMKRSTSRPARRFKIVVTKTQAGERQP